MAGCVYSMGEVMASLTLCIALCPHCGCLIRWTSMDCEDVASFRLWETRENSCKRCCCDVEVVNLYFDSMVLIPFEEVAV
jgi:hypothetical protein